MSFNFKTRDLIVFVPDELCPHSIVASIPAECIVKKEGDEPTDATIGVLNVHLFKYTDFQQMVDYITRPESLLIAMQSAGFKTEIEYSDKLNEIIGVKKYTVLSTSALHAVPTEQSATDRRARIIRNSNVVEAINGLLGDWFRKPEQEYFWHVGSDKAQHSCSKAVVIKTAA